MAWRHETITWTNVDLLSVRSHGIHLHALSLEDLEKPFNKTRFKIAVLKRYPGLPGANELKKKPTEHRSQITLWNDHLDQHHLSITLWIT